MKDLLIYDKDSGLGHYSQHAKGNAIKILGFAKTFCKLEIKENKIEQYEDQEVCNECDKIANGTKPTEKTNERKTKRSKRKSKQNLLRLPGDM